MLKKIRQYATIYFAFQGIGVIIWWCLLFFYPRSRAYFQMGGSENILLSFWLPDLFLLAVGSLFASWFIRTENKLATIAMWFVTGTISYASLYCYSFALITDTGWLGVLFMFPAMLWSGVFAVSLTPVMREFMFRQNRSEKTSWIIVKTFTQIVLVWTLILVVFPYLIIQLENKLGVPQFTFPFQTTISIILLISISSLGVSSAYLMSKVGKGTPLPLDYAQNLVIKGAYSYVRNPMAISGIGQGVAVGLFLGSPLVLLYALMGAFIWQVIFRELEETDLQKRFGKEYEDYCKNVRCWIPNLNAYKIDKTKK